MSSLERVASPLPWLFQKVYTKLIYSTGFYLCFIDGVVVACDINEDFTNIAKKFWSEAGVSHKIRLEIAPATETLSALVSTGEQFDFAFIDADKVILTPLPPLFCENCCEPIFSIKGGYDSYYELCLLLMRKGGIIAFDNTLWDGKVVR